MTPFEASSILAYLVEAWPSMEVGEHTAEVWADALSGVDTQHAHTAARKLVKSEQWPPSVARFLEVAREVKRAEDTDRQARALGPPPTTDRATAAGRMRGIRAGWDAVQATRPKHDHKRGGANCPKCSTSAATVAEHAPEILDAILGGTK